MFSELINHIPWYVYLTLYILIKRGIIALKDQIVPLNKVIIFPIAMTIWALYDINSMFGIFHIFIILSILIGISLGIISGFRILKNDNPIFKDGNFYLKGSSVTLILVTAIFVYKFVTFGIIGFNPFLLQSIIFDIILSSTFTFIAGITLGRLIYLMKVAYNSKNIDAQFTKYQIISNKVAK